MPWTTPETFTAGQTLTAASMNVISENLNALYAPVRRLATQTNTGNVSAGATVGATEIFTDVTWTADGTSAYLVRVVIPWVETATTANDFTAVHLTNGSTTSLGVLGFVGKGDGTRSAIGAVCAHYYYTPSAGNATINASPVYSTASGGGAGGISSGGNQTVPARIEVFGPALT